MQATVMLAGMDQSHKRHEDALTKYRLVARYAEKTNQPALAAVAFNGMGETYEKMGEPEKAERMYGTALESSSEGDPPATPVMLNAMLNNANLAMVQERWPDAEGYYKSAEPLAFMQNATETRIRCMEQRGVAVYMQKRQQEALHLWEVGSSGARECNFPALEQSILKKQRDHYAFVKDDAAVARLDVRIADAASRTPPPAVYAHAHANGASHGGAA
jgi:hypothetical protein